MFDDFDDDGYRMGTYGTTLEAIIEELRDAAGDYADDYDYDAIVSGLRDIDLLVENDNQEYYWHTPAGVSDWEVNDAITELFKENDISDHDDDDADDGDTDDDAF